LAAAGPDLAGSLELLLTYPFPDSSLSSLNYREAQSGGVALFTNMTATVDADLTHLLCRYVIDQSGALRQLPLEEALTQGKCGVENGESASTTEGSGGPQSTSSTSSTPSVLEGIEGRPVQRVPGADQPAGRLGLPSVTGVTP
jgi:phospholipid/cholesterol/gamma-HCH transport system substrate-binding protein